MGGGIAENDLRAFHKAKMSSHDTILNTVSRGPFE